MPPKQHQLNQQQLAILAKILSNCERLAVIGVGSDLRCDDYAGVIVTKEIERLIKKNPVFQTRILAVEGGSAPESVTGQVAAFKPSHVLFVDAADLGLKAGEIAVIDRDAIKGASFSTHMLPLSVTVMYIERSMGAQVGIVGIQPISTEFCKEPSSLIVKASKELAKAIVEIIKKQLPL